MQSHRPTILLRFLAMISLVFLISSLVVAVYTVRWVLMGWAREWIAKQEEEKLFLMKKLKAVDESKVTDEQEKMQIEQLLNALEATELFHKPSSLTNRVVGHTLLLIGGLLFYVATQIISSLQ